MERTITWNYGGGTQSSAIAVLIAQGRLPRPETILICDTGREGSETWEWTERYINPLLATVGLTVEVAPHSLASLDLYDSSGGLMIPAFTSKGKKRRFCSHAWKALVARRYYRSKGYGPKRPITTWLGISLDEIGRARSSAQQKKWQHMAYPLLDMVPMRRAQCRQLVIDTLGVEPPRTACWMCPYKDNTSWRHLRDHFPGDFAQAVQLEQEIREQTGRPYFFHKARIPLEQVDFSEPDRPLIPLLGEVEHCDSGHCWV